MRHNRIRKVLLSSAFIAAASLAVAPAIAQTPYDGLWNVTLVTKAGSCEPAAHSTLTVTAMIAAPLLLTALITGLVIGMLQAATQINEATLSFIPKLLVLVLALFVTGPWILRTLIDFTRAIYASIPNMIG